MNKLSSLKSERLNIASLSKANPSNKTYQIASEKARRAVTAKERELFCDIKEQ